jgi:ubiquitin carboxyl-terminal hydrolase 25/28
VKRIYLEALEVIQRNSLDPQLKQAISSLRLEHGIPVKGTNQSTTMEDQSPVDFSLPVGLQNIGNTCYLNSLLQYLFTVKPVRDIILNYEDVRLDLTEESIKARHVGSFKLSIDRGEAVVAQACKLPSFPIHALSAKQLLQLCKNLLLSLGIY